MWRPRQLRRRSFSVSAALAYRHGRNKRSCDHHRRDRGPRYGVRRAARRTSRGLAAQPTYSNVSLVDLPPVITNLADPTSAWVRLEAAVVVDKQATTKPDVLGAEIADDILGFMKTLSLSQIGGASGLQHLREDLSERASIRSQGHVRELIIQTLVVQ
ncbi:MAG: flagellar basal body-associated FliL family protein [Methylovirgula sp.]